MRKIFSQQVLRKVAKTWPHHEDDARILTFDPGDEFDQNLRVNILRAMKFGFAKAAIFPHQDPEGWEKSTLETRMNEAYIVSDGARPDLSIRDENVYMHNVKVMAVSDLPDTFSEACDRSLALISPEDRRMYWTYFPREVTNSIHYDHGLNVHISGYKPIDFVAGELSDRQGILVRLEDLERIQDEYEKVLEHVHTANPGDLVVFNEEFAHRSSMEPSAGTDEQRAQLNFLARPEAEKDWPDDILESLDA